MKRTGFPRKPHHKRLSRRVSLPRPTKPVNPFSKRRAKRDAVYEQRRRQVFDSQDGLCAFNDGGLLCGNEVTDVHHVAGRGGPDSHRLSNLVGLCWRHHRWAHYNPSLAYELGLMRRRNGGRPDDGEVA